MKVNNHYENVDLVASFFSEEETKVKQMNDFIKDNGLENTDTFFINNVYIPKNYKEEKILKCTSENTNTVHCHLVDATFIDTIKKGFNDFDNTFKGLFLQQFEILDKKLTTNRIKLFIGSTADKTNPGMYGDGLYKLDIFNGIYVNFSKEIVIEQMEKPIFFIQQEGDNIPEIKAVPLKDFVGLGETDKYRLLAKCAAYLLFHELFHVNTFVDCKFDANAYKTNLQNFYIIEGVADNDLKKLFLNRDLGDDALNTLCKFENILNSVPGECDFINKLYPDKPTMRLYCGRGLDFCDPVIRENCLNVFNSIFREKLAGKTLTPTTDQLKSDAQQLSENLILQKMQLHYYQVIYKDDHDLTDNHKNKVQKTENIINSLNTNDINKKDFIQFKNELYKLVKLMNQVSSKSWGVNLRTKIHNFLQGKNENGNVNSLKKQIEITKTLVQDFKNFQKTGNINLEDQEKLLEILNADIKLLDVFLQPNEKLVDESNEIIKICVSIEAAHAQQKMPDIKPEPNFKLSNGCIIC